jgi:hypothetical protein
MRLQDLDILTDAVDVLSKRSERVLELEAARQSGLNSPGMNNKLAIPDSQMRRLKYALDRLGRVVEDSSTKAKVIEEEVGQWELLKDRR